MKTSFMFKAQVGVLYRLSLNTNWLRSSLVSSSILLLCVWSQDSKYNHQCFERTTRAAYTLLGSESAAEEGIEYWLWRDNFVNAIV